MKLSIKQTSSLRTGFTVAEVMMSLTILGIVMAAAITGSTSLTGAMTASENYSVGELQVVDYMTLDLRRATSYGFATVGSNLTLPLKLTLPQYYAADGRSPNPGQRTKVDLSNKKGKKKHRVLEARFYYHYGVLGAEVPVKYYLSNGSLFRKEGTLPAREIGRGIEAVNFTPTTPAAPAEVDTPAKQLLRIELNPVVTTKVAFLPTKRAKIAPPPLSSSTFMRHYYYSDY